MKPFNLEEAKAGKPVCTRDGRKARIISCNSKGSPYPIIALVGDSKGNEEAFGYTLRGEFFKCQNDELDLMMVGDKSEGWINIYGTEYSKHIRKLGSSIYPNEQDAIKEGKTYRYYITTIKIEWEE